MGKSHFCYTFAAIVFVVGIFGETCRATTYRVGDTAGWDISSDLDTWVKDKIFKVGDSLLFSYSSSNSVSEVKKESFDACNVTNVITTSRDGNTTIPLPSPGDRYFISGNTLYCLGGMKLHVNVDQDQETANSPANSPQSSTTSSLQPSNKKNQPSTLNPSSTSDGFCTNGGGNNYLVLVILSVLGTVVSLTLT